MNQLTNENKKATACFIDCRRAFDTLVHEYLLNKLEHYNIETKLLKCYLEDRKQAVKIGEFYSEKRDVVCGVPQGSILGPILFNVYLSDIYKACKDNALELIFADDLTVLVKAVTLELSMHETRENFKLLKDWLDANKLSLNVEKTKVMNFGAKKNFKPKHLKIDENISIEFVESFKLVGTHIDNKLLWKQHIDNVCKKIGLFHSILNRGKVMLPKQAKIMFYNALLRPHLEYCIGIWGNATYASKLLTKQKAILRTIVGKQWRSHITNFFKKEKILKIHDLYKVNLLKICLKRLRYKHFQEHFLKVHIPARQTRSADSRNFDMQTTHLRNQVIYQCQKFWNDTGRKYNNAYRIKTEVKKLTKDIIDNYVIETCRKRNCFVCRRGG